MYNYIHTYAGDCDGGLIVSQILSVLIMYIYIINKWLHYTYNGIYY